MKGYREIPKLIAALGQRKLDRKEVAAQYNAFLLQRKKGRTVVKLVGGWKLLDVGAGIGVFMKTAYESGWHVEGVEISPYCSEFIKETYGFNVYTESLIYLELRKNSYDLLSYAG